MTAKQIFRRVVVTILTFMIIMGGLELTNYSAIAATKTKLSSSKMTIGIGSYESNGAFFCDSQMKYTLSVTNTTKNAKYSFTSSDKKIVSIQTKGKNAYLTGVKAGKATITCKQTLNGVTKIVGKCSVQVKAATVEAVYIADELAVTTATLGGWEADTICTIKYRNPKATYTYTCADANFHMEDTYLDMESFIDTGYYTFGQTYTAKKAGTYTVTVTEDYKKKTRKVGTFTVTVHDTTIKDEVSLVEGDFIYVFQLVNYVKADKYYYFEGKGYDEEVYSDDSIVYIDEYGYIQGAKEGTAEMEIYEGTSEDDRTLIGTCKIVVSKANTVED